MSIADLLNPDASPENILLSFLASMPVVCRGGGGGGIGGAFGVLRDVGLGMSESLIFDIARGLLTTGGSTPEPNPLDGFCDCLPFVVPEVALS